jgi:hypothetical protein
MKKAKKRQLSVAIIVDFMGSSMASPEEEIAEHKKRFSEILKGFSLKFSTPKCVMPDMVADLVVYDFGGMMPGTSLMEDNSRAVIQWAVDHPSALVVVVSSHTFGAYVKPEMQALGLDKVKNVVDFYDGDQDEAISAWFGK